jgi:DNA polymerase-1
MKIIQTELLTPASIQRMSSTEREWVYNGLDCCLTYEIDDELELVMDDIARGTYQMSLALQAPVLEMNMRGILVDLAQRDKAIAQLKADAIKVDGNFDKLCRSIFGREVNSASPKQCIDLFYNWLGLPEQKKRNTKGEYVATTDREALEKLASIYYPAKPFVSHILKSRDIWKQVGTLETPLLNGRFYTSLSVAGTKTGRLASALSDFAVGSNLQNIDRRIKRMFIADPGKKFANVDLEQADARNIGAQTWNLFPQYRRKTKGQNFLDACEGGDLHTSVAMMVWEHDFPWEFDLTKPFAKQHNREIADQPFYREKTYRDSTKILGHGSNFNGQPPQMSKHTKIAQSVISEFQFKYFEAFPEVHDRIEWVGEQLVKYGALTTLFGRRRYFLKRRSDNKTLNEGCAFDPQSMTADEINWAMLRFYSIVKPRFPSAELMIQVHDSLLIQYDESDEEAILPYIKEAFKVELTLAEGRKFFVPCEVQVGWNWDYQVKWSEKDFEKGKCSKSDVGQVKENPNGMIKYKGADTRQRV